MSELKIIPLGGLGKVTQNLFVYEYDQEILLIDCGIGFPDMYMPGVDSIVPDISYLQDQVTAGKKIIGLVFSHGHDDHIAATPYLLPDLPDFPIFASPLTAGFAGERLRDKGIDKKIEVISDKKYHKLSDNFSFKMLSVTHSVPDTKHIVIRTPEGVVYHGSDFKLDPSPVDGVMSDYEGFSEAAEENIMLMLIDCLRVEKDNPIKSESTVGPALEKEMVGVTGKVLVTLMSSHIHRIQQVVDIAAKLRRKVVFVGRSVEQNVRVARDLGKINIPKGIEVRKRQIDQYRDNELVVIIAGSQGQEGSSLVRAVSGEHRIVQINSDDKVIFSATVIPGNEIPYYDAVDELSRKGIDVVYPAVEEGIHQSGHASRAEQKEIVSLIKPKYVMPIGGADRHRVRFKNHVAKELGYTDKTILVPKSGEILSFAQGRYEGVKQKITLRPRIVDGLGVGDVGPVVLSDRLALAKSGIVVLVIPKVKGELDVENITVISRGFVFMKHADEVVAFIQEKAKAVIQSVGRDASYEDIKRKIERSLGRKLYKVLQREPMIVPVIMEM